MGSNIYTVIEVCSKLQMRPETLSRWYRWRQKAAVDRMRIEVPVLPMPTKLGKNNMYTEEDLDALRKFKSWYKVNGWGIMREYNNADYKYTKKRIGLTDEHKK